MAYLVIYSAAWYVPIKCLADKKIIIYSIFEKYFYKRYTSNYCEGTVDSQKLTYSMYEQNLIIKKKNVTTRKYENKNKNTENTNPKDNSLTLIREDISAF